MLVICILGSMLLQGIRWWMLIHPFDHALSLSKALKAHFIGLYYSIVLPTSAAQDVVRAALLSKDTISSLSWASTWVSRVLGLLTLAFMSIYGLFNIDRSGLPDSFFKSIIITFCILILISLLSFSKKFTSPFRNFTQRILPKRFFTLLDQIRQGVYNYRGKGGTVFVVFVVTLLMQLFITVGGCLVIFGISGKFLLFECLVYLPMIEILCISLPLTPNGIGIREGLLALMFGHVGLNKEQLGIYIVLGFFSISLKLVGGIPLLFGSEKDNSTIKSALSHSIKT